MVQTRWMLRAERMTLASGAPVTMRVEPEVFRLLEGLDHIPGAARDVVEILNEDDASGLQLLGEDAAEGQVTHALGHVAPVAAGVGAEGDAAAPPDGGADAAVAGAAGVLLPPGLCAAAGDLASHLHLVGALPPR